MAQLGLSQGSALRLAAAVACVVGALADGRGLVLPPHRQVDEEWIGRYRGWVYGAGFGLQLGFGLTTVVVTADVPLIVFLALLSGQVGTGATLGLIFGLARALPVAGLARVGDADALRRFHRRLQGAAQPARWATVAAMAGAGVVLGALALAGPTAVVR